MKEVVSIILPAYLDRLHPRLLDALLGIRFEDQEVVVRPALYAGSPPVHADLRFRMGRLLLEIPGPGAFRFALVNGRRREVEKDGAVRLGIDFEGGSVSFHA